MGIEQKNTQDQPDEQTDSVEKDDVASQDESLAEVSNAESDVESAEDGEEDSLVAGQLGTERYVLASFFLAGMLLAYILGRFIHGVWVFVANKDFFVRSLPRLAAITDEDKTTYGMALGAVIAIATVWTTYKKPDVRLWADEVATELGKVKWPTRKDVYNSTIVVIATSAVATLYLAMLDRFWSFVTNLVYGDG